MTSERCSIVAIGLLVLALVVASFTAIHPARAQDASSSRTATTLPEVAESFESPRRTMRGFLRAGRAGDWATAAKHLDLREEEAADAPRLARHLGTVLDRTLWVDPDMLSDSPEGESDDGLPPALDLVGTIATPVGPAKILVERVTGPDGGQWKIAYSTVALIPALWKAFGYGPLAEYLPTPFFEIHFLDVEAWQWMALTALLLASIGLAWLLTGPVLRVARAIARRTNTPIDDVPAELIVGPVRLAVGTTVFWAGVYQIALALPVQGFVVGATKGLLTLDFTWLALRLIRPVARGIAPAIHDVLQVFREPPRKSLSEELASAIRILISYRRADTAFVATTLHDKLAECFGGDNVILDVDAIPAGRDFRKHLQGEVTKCDVVLAVIDERWLDARDPDGRRRLDLPTDWVRIELETALVRDIPVIPLLLPGARIPAETELPESLRELAYRQALLLRPGRDFQHDMDVLRREIERTRASLAHPG